MKFNSQRPESLNVELKRIAIEFTPVRQDRERVVISQFVDHVFSGNENRFVHIDDWRVLSAVEQSTRAYERVKFNNCFIHAITVRATDNKVIKLRAELVDLSAGGCCIAIPEGVKVHRKRRESASDQTVEDPPNIKIKLDFLGGIVLKGVIRYLKTPKMDPNIDLDNYDFEHSLPQYWKINV